MACLCRHRHLCVHWNEKKKQVFARFLCECWLKSGLNLCKLSEIVTSSPCLKQTLEANCREVTIHVPHGRRPKITSLWPIKCSTFGCFWNTFYVRNASYIYLTLRSEGLWSHGLKVDKNSFKSAVVIGHSGHFLFSSVKTISVHHYVWKWRHSFLWMCWMRL